MESVNRAASGAGASGAARSAFGRFVGVVSCLLLSVSAASVLGQEPFLQFAEGLRQRGYYDTALEYLDSLKTRTDLPAEVREVLDLERGVTLQQFGAASRVEDEREKALTDAAAALQAFLAQHGQHPQAAMANSLLGELLFNRSESLIWKTLEQESAEARAPLQAEARGLIDQARGIFQTAHDQYKVQYEKFPKFIDESKDEELLLQRQEAENRYLRALLNLARCTYERGQTFDRGSEERKQTLMQAAKEFEDIHTSRRTNSVGLYARLMEGKCFQEQDDIGRALGIYNEILGHPSDKPFMQSLRGTAKHFRLICLNDPQRSDHDVVIQEALQWSQANRQLTTTSYGLGILWEQAIAEEKKSQTRELPEKEKTDLLQFALNHAEQVAKYPGAFREPALSMARRLKVVLGEKDREPRDFATAFERARGMISQIQEYSDEVARAADDAERAAKRAALDNHLGEVARLLRLALDLREPGSDAKAVADTRYLLSYVMLRQGNALDAIVLSTYTMAQDQKSAPETALNCTEVAMAAAVAAWNRAEGDRDFETRLLKDVCQQILTLYPQSSRAGEARMRLGNVYRTLQQPLEAVKWFLEVPESDPQYASARIAAGQSYWATWTQNAATMVEPGAEPAISAEEVARWKTEAKALLIQGIDLTRAKAGSMSLPGEELAAAEVSLAAILNQEGDFAGAIARLTANAENSVMAAIELPEGSERPEAGIQSRSFAGLAWRLLLRAYVGTQQIDQALQSMSQLEKVGGDDILQAYTQLGMELQEELQRLQAAGEAERLGQVRTSFEQFLGKVYESRNKSDFNSLLWIGETYYGLGLGVAADPSAAEGYFEKAGNAYSEILQQSLVSADGAPAVQLRLARCRRRQGQFTEALQLVETILAANAMNLDVQFEAAHVLSDWGEKSEPERLKQAILGPPATGGKPAVVWGWATLSKRLRQLVMKDPKSEFRPRFFEARYELGSARRRLARVLPDKAAGTAQLKSAMAELASLVQAYRDLEPATYARFDRLYQDLQADLGESPTPLAQASPANEPEPAAEPVSVAASGAAAGGAPAAPTAAGPAAQGAGGLTAVIVSVLGLALAGGLFVMMRRPKAKLPLASANRVAKISVAVPESSAAGFPGDLQIEAPPELDFAQLAALPGVGGRSSRAAGKPAAKPGVRPVAGGADAAGGAVKPRPRPAEGGAASKPRPPGESRPAGEGRSAGEPRPPGEGRPARPPRVPKPEGEGQGGAGG